MLRSFRLRLALISALISGLVVLAFGSLAWWSLSLSNLEELDADLRHFGYRVALRTGRNVDTQRLETSLSELFGQQQAANRFFTLLASNQAPIFASANWPVTLDYEKFQPGANPLDPQPQDHYRRPSEKRVQPRIVFEPRFYTAEIEGTQYRVGVFANPDVILVLGANLNEHASDMHQLRTAFLIALPGALLVVALGAAFVGWRALQPVETLSRDMESVSAQALDHRLSVNGTDREFKVIIRNYNAMLERLERSFHQANRFSADASHELKTPLAIMQGTLERALSQCQENSTAQAALTELLEQTGHQRSILESLLLLSRADAGKLEISRERIHLSELLGTWLEDASFLAEPRGISVRSEIEPHVWTEGDPVMLQQVAHNLFSNAVRYNWDGGQIVCRLSFDGMQANWQVTNTGQPIPAADRERIFERFQRGDSRRAEPGIGLGLSLAREIVQAHGGIIELVRSNAEETCFRIQLRG